MYRLFVFIFLLDFLIYTWYILSIDLIYKRVFIMSELKLFTAKVDEDLLTAFKNACEQNDTTASQAIRQFMREYVKNTGQPDLFKVKVKRSSSN